MALWYGRAGRVPLKNGGFRPGQYHKMSPKNVEVLRVAGVDFAALATNHAIDFDVGGAGHGP